MIWALLFALIIANSESPYVIPNLDKYIKKHVVNKSNSTEILKLLKEDRKHRKSLRKEQTQRLKKIHELNYSRESKVEDFEKVFDEIITERKLLQGSDKKVKLKIQELISADEWNLIKKDAIKNLSKTAKKKQKKIDKFKKKYSRLEAKTADIINDKERLESVQSALKKFKSVILQNLDKYKEYVLNVESLPYQHNTTSEGMDEDFDKANKWRKEIFDAFTTTHYKMVQSTTPEEWRLLVKQLKKLN